MHFTRYRHAAVIILGAVAALRVAVPTASDADDNRPHRGTAAHVHAPVPGSYATTTAPPDIWTNPAVLARGQAIHAEKCAVCHGRDGAGDGPAAAGLALKPASFRDKAMVAEMTDAYWFWRVSEGGAVEPFKSAGSTMPAWKNDLSVEDRWAIVAYQHSLSGHAGSHTVAEHPEMPGVRPHPEPRGVAFTTAWVTRDHRWQPRGPWKWGVMRDLPQLYREFNGIDFGYAHLAETLLKTQDPERVETARLEVLDFIFSSPPVPPDEEQVAPTFNRLAWEVAKTFDWTHIFHRSLYDLFASDVQDKDVAYQRLLADYLEKPEAITPHRLDHHGALWSLAESKAFRDKFGKFNTQIWAYHWLQARRVRRPVARRREDAAGAHAEGHRLLPRLSSAPTRGVAVHAHDARGSSQFCKAIPRGGGDLRQPAYASRQLRRHTRAAGSVPDVRGTTRRDPPDLSDLPPSKPRCEGSVPGLSRESGDGDGRTRRNEHGSTAAVGES